jgi:hypothetical protein
VLRVYVSVAEFSALASFSVAGWGVVVDVNLFFKGKMNVNLICRGIRFGLAAEVSN